MVCVAGEPCVHGERDPDVALLPTLPCSVVPLHILVVQHRARPLPPRHHPLRSLLGPPSRHLPLASPALLVLKDGQRLIEGDQGPPEAAGGGGVGHPGHLPGWETAADWRESLYRAEAGLGVIILNIGSETRGFKMDFA